MKPPDDATYCKVQIPWGGSSRKSSQCSRRAKFEGYCRQHSPNEVEKRNVKQEKQFEYGKKRRAQERLGPDAIKALESVHKLLKLGMEQSALDVAEAWLESNKL